MTVAWKEQQWQERAITPLFLPVSSSPHLADLKPRGLSPNISAPFSLFALEAEESLGFPGFPGLSSRRRLHWQRVGCLHSPTLPFPFFSSDSPAAEGFSTSVLRERGIPPLALHTASSQVDIQLLHFFFASHYYLNTDITPFSTPV